MHRNEEKGERGKRIAAAIAFVLLGAVTAWCGAGLQPGNGTASGTGTEEATPSSAELLTGMVPVIWYEDDGLYLYQPEEKETLKLSNLTDAGMDRMTRFLTDKDPASSALVTPDGTGVYYMKELTTDYVGVTRGNLWYRGLPEKGKMPEEVPVAEKILSFQLLTDGSAVWLDENGSFRIFSGVPGNGAEPQKIASGIKEYHVSKEEPAAFLISESKKGYFFRKDTGKWASAEGIEKIVFTSDDLKKIYYATEQNDLFCVENMGLPRIVDVDVEDAAVIRSTGNAYYLKKDPETDTGSLLGFFDGTLHPGLLRGVSTMDSTHLEDTEKDRLIVYTGANDGHSIWFMMGEKPLYTGLTISYEGLMDLCPDAVQDVLYVARQREDQIGSADQGGIYAMRYTEKGFTNPEPLFEGAVIISAAREGRVFAGTYPIPEEGSTLFVDGVKVSDHVASFFWDESGVSDKLQIYRNVFSDDYYVSGEVDDWSVGSGIRPIAYGVREYHGFEDGSFTMLCDFDEDEMTGKLVYWDGEGEPVVLSESAQGTRPGQGEK